MSSYGVEVPAIPEAAFGSEPRAATAGTCVLGWLGKMVEFSEERGPAAPPSHISSAGKVLSYYDGTDAGEDSYIIADWTDADDEEVDFGPLFEPDVSLVLDKWWPNNDWSAGLTVHLTGTANASTTASGQWSVLKGRAPDDPYKFLLERPFARVPAAGDIFEIGTLVWAVFPAIASPPFSGMLQFENGELSLKRLSGAKRGHVELYGSGNKRELQTPLYPFEPDAIKVGQFLENDLDNFLRYSWTGSDSEGKTAMGREVAAAFAAIIRGGLDFKLDSCDYELTLADIRRRLTFGG